jgi:hypothetical protein
VTNHAVEPAALAGIDTDQESWSVDRAALVRALDALELGRVDVDLIVSMLSLQDATLAPFEMRLGNWSIDVPAATARALFNSIVLTGALAAVHEPSIPAAVLTFVVSALFDIHRLTVSPDRENLRAVVRDPGSTAEDWYRQQPEHLRAELTEAEFTMIVKQFRDIQPDQRSGLNQPTDRWVLVRLPGRAKDSDGATGQPTVFISYTHDSPEHKAQVRRFAELVRSHGIMVVLDQWATTHRQDWSTWAPKSIVRSDYTLMIASPNYKAAADDFDDSDRNPGAKSEAAVIRDLLHGDRATWKRKLLPILLPGHDKTEIPYFMQPNSADWYQIDELSDNGIRDLVAVLTASATGSPAMPHPAQAGQAEDQPEAPRPVETEPRWRSLPKPLDVAWRVDVFRRHGFAMPCALELHLIPVDGKTLTVSRLQRVPDMLAVRGRQASFFTVTEALRTGNSEDAAWALTDGATSGLAVLRRGQRTAWAPLLDAKIGYIVNRDYARETLARMLTLLISLDIPLAATLASTAGLEPLELVREAPAADAQSNTASSGFHQIPAIRLACEEAVTSAEIIGSPESVADELAARVLIRLHGRVEDVP